MSLADLLAEIAEALQPVQDAIPEVAIYGYWNGEPTPPALDVYPSTPFQTGAGFGSGNSQIFFTVRARVQLADAQSGQALLLRLLDPEDAASVEVALQDTATITEGGVSGFTVYADDLPVNERLLGCEWRVTTFL